MLQQHAESLDPDTAPRRRSIWKNIDRPTMDRQMRALKDHVTGRRSYDEPSPRDEDASCLLPLTVEKSLADDLAFIAACQPQVDFVSAVAVVQEQKTPSLSFTLAVNEGISAEVWKTFDEVFALLRRRAKKGIAREDCQKQLFRVIVHLNRNRLLGRLGSARFKKPSHLQKDYGPLPARLRRLFATSTQRSFAPHHRTDINRLDGQISGLEAAFLQLEAGDSANLIPDLENIIMEAFALTVDGTKLPSRLEALGCPTAVLDARDVRELGKVANYWRIARNLTLCSHQFSHCFPNAEWHALPTYSVSTGSKLVPRKHVHAEIQQLVHFELRQPLAMPRVIGVSKEACFLCDSFIRAHGRFSISGAHRQMFPKWTVPNLKEYAPQTVERFRKALVQVRAEVQEEFVKPRKNVAWRPFPQQSAINLKVFQPITPSTSTLVMLSASDVGGGACSGHPNKVVTEHAVSQAGQNGSIKEAVAASGRSRRAVLPGVEQQEGSKIIETHPTETSLEVVFEGAASECTDWVEIFACFSSTPDEGLPTANRHPYTGGTLTLAPDTDDERGRRVSLADVPINEELVIERDNADDAQGLSFTLVGLGGRCIRFQCQWHVASYNLSVKIELDWSYAMPLRPAVPADLLPASKVLAAAFHNDYLFGEYIHPHRNQFPEDAYLYYLRFMREAYWTEPGEHLIVSYSLDPSTGNEEITGLAHWIRNYSDPLKASWTSQAMVKIVGTYNTVENYIWPNRAIDNDHERVLPEGYAFYKHHWTGTRADSWTLSLLGVGPQFMKRGYGRELVAWGFDRSREEGVSVSVVSVPDQERFYRACGFDVEVGTWSDDGGNANPMVAAGLEPAPILFCDHGRGAMGMKMYGE
ncbi:uncharacterized protein LTR77_001436 [Saxophila tyrrhenica]|uniref:N-acetyltransferase domain-containing protein n=1 Tax=Saxophila tyrrhenica TaxID=1690608 RepID=A0AAV9PNI7_9PEZI|nr:hypothetical protein LTR77_001436 [Saxophila tyrrhenica]